MARGRISIVLLLISFSLLISFTFNTANARQSSLLATLTVSPLSGHAPFSPSARYNYSGAMGPVMVLIYWGDGSSNDLTSCRYSCPSHTYGTPGTYSITVSVTDITGRTASDSKTIVVNPAPPQLRCVKNFGISSSLYGT